MSFVITDGEKYIFKNLADKFVIVDSESMGDIYDELSDAKKAYEQLPKIFKKTFKIKESEDVDVIIKESEIPEEIVEWITKMTSLCGVKQDAIIRKSDLTKRLSNLENNVENIKHKIELQDLDDTDLLKISKNLKSTLEERRNVKNELRILGCVLDILNNGNNITSNSIARLENEVERLKSRKYTFR